MPENILESIYKWNLKLSRENKKLRWFIDLLLVVVTVITLLVTTLSYVVIKSLDEKIGNQTDLIEFQSELLNSWDVILEE